MSNIKGLRFIQKMKAKLSIQDEFQKLDFLSGELKKGYAADIDKDYWDVSLKRVEEFLEYIPEHKETYAKYKKRRGLVDNQARVRNMRLHEGPVLVSGSLEGSFDRLVKQREANENPGDVIVVQGNWMKSETDINSIRKAMELSEEGIIFLKGRREELFLQLAKEETSEVFFVSTLPMEVQTPQLVITTGNSLEEPTLIEQFINNDSPNMTQKTMVAVQPKDNGETEHLVPKNLILVAKHDAVRLELKDN